MKTKITYVVRRSSIIMKSFSASRTINFLLLKSFYSSSSVSHLYTSYKLAIAQGKILLFYAISVCQSISNNFKNAISLAWLIFSNKSKGIC